MSADTVRLTGQLRSCLTDLEDVMEDAQAIGLFDLEANLSAVVAALESAISEVPDR